METDTPPLLDETTLHHSWNERYMNTTAQVSEGAGSGVSWVGAQTRALAAPAPCQARTTSEIAPCDSPRRGQGGRSNMGLAYEEADEGFGGARWPRQRGRLLISSTMLVR